jgi:hypothetical protein
MNRIMGIDYNEAFSHKNLLAIYRGQLAEQFVGQEFATQTDNQLYYWTRDAKNSNAEVDYLMMIDGTLYPVEVKDGPSGKLCCLHIYREAYEPFWSVVFHAGKAGVLKISPFINSELLTYRHYPEPAQAMQAWCNWPLTSLSMSCPLYSASRGTKKKLKSPESRNKHSCYNGAS